MNGPGQDDDSLLKRIAQGDEHAFGTWIARAEPSLRRALRRFATIVDIESIVQEAALRAWIKAPSIRTDGGPDSLLRWTHRVAANLAKSEARRRRKHEAPPAPEDSEVPDLTAAGPADPFLLARIRECFERLHGSPLAVLKERLVSGGGASDRALADRIGQSFDAFRKNLSRARNLLKECLEKAGVRLEEVWR